MNASSLLKCLIGWILCFAIRLFPWRPPNVEPILATAMPFGKHLGPVTAFLFASLNIMLYDLMTRSIGSWTYTSAATYGIVGIAAAYWFAHRKGTPLNYALFAIPAVLFYDAITGVLLGPLLFDISFAEAFIGQIPFTVNHLISSVVLALVVSPLVDRWILRNSYLSFTPRAKKVG